MYTHVELASSIKLPFPLIGTPDWKLKLQLTAVATPWFARVAMVSPPTFSKHILPHEYHHTLTCLDPTYVILQSMWPGNRSLKVCEVHTFFKKRKIFCLSLIYLIYLFFEGRNWCLSNVIRFACLQSNDFKMTRKNHASPAHQKLSRTKIRLMTQVLRFQRFLRQKHPENRALHLHHHHHPRPPVWPLQQQP